MVAVNVSLFRGMSRKITPRLLPEDMAVQVTNMDLDSGSLRPLKGLSTNGISTNTVNGAINGATKSLFQARSGDWFRFQDLVSVMDSPIAEDAYDRVYYSGQAGGPHITSTQAPTTSHFLGLPKPVASVGATANPQVSANLDTETAVSRAYCTTFVTVRGEEGPPSDPTPILELRSDQAITLASGPASGSYVNQRNIAFYRVYRTDANGVFRQVVDISATAGGLTVTADAVLDSALGEELVSQEWNAPPLNMLGLCSLSNGICAGFTEQTLCFSEAYLPHAWPTRYQLTTQNDIVAIRPLETGLLVMTKGKPYIVQGSDPAGMVMTELNVPYGIASAQSAVDIGGAVIYSSEDGLVLVSSSGASLLTESTFTSDQWMANHAPNSIKGFLWQGKYVGFHPRVGGTGGINGFILDPKGGKASFTALRLQNSSSDSYDSISAGAASSQEDNLRVVLNGSTAYEFAAGPYLLAYWSSRHYYTERPINLGAAMVAFGNNFGGGSTSVVLVGSENADEIPATDIRHQETIADTERISTFRCPSGYKSSVFYVGVTTKREIHSISFAESPSELR